MLGSSSFLPFSLIKGKHFVGLIVGTLLLASCGVPADSPSIQKKNLDMIASQIMELAQKDGIVDKQPVTSTMRLPSIEPYMSTGIAELVAQVDAYASKDGTALLEVFKVGGVVPMVAIYFKMDSPDTVGDEYVKFVNFLASVMAMGGMHNAESARVMVSDAIKRTNLNAGDMENGPQIAAGSFVAQFASAPPAYYRVYLRPAQKETHMQAGEMLDSSSQSQKGASTAGDDYLPPLP